jgi:hypothetical protein
MTYISELEELINEKHLYNWEKTLSKMFIVKTKQHHCYVYHKDQLITKYSTIKQPNPGFRKTLIKNLIDVMNMT